MYDNGASSLTCHKFRCDVKICDCRSQLRHDITAPRTDHILDQRRRPDRLGIENPRVQKLVPADPKIDRWSRYGGVVRQMALFSTDTLLNATL